MAQAAQLLKFPRRRRFFGSPSIGRPRGHLQLPIEIVRQNRRQQEKLIPQQSAHGNIIHLAAVMIHQGLLGATFQSFNALLDVDFMRLMGKETYKEEMKWPITS